MLRDILIALGVIITGLVTGLFLAVVISALLALPVMWLWNYVCPSMFGFHEIGFCHAWALNTLCGFLFKSTNYNMNTEKK